MISNKLYNDLTSTNELTNQLTDESNDQPLKAGTYKSSNGCTLCDSYWIYIYQNNSSTNPNKRKAATR